MSATEELRRLLDERGVKHYDGQGYTAWGKERRFSANENTNGTFCVHMFWFDCTPAQAIEISLERGKCKLIGCRCSECGVLIGADASMSLQYKGDDLLIARNQDVNEQRREKCRDIGYGLRFECSECHQTVGGETPRFCPNCGREVEQ